MRNAVLAAITLSIAGAVISVYLTLQHYAGVTPACPANGTVSCEAVLSSSYAVIAGTSIPTSAAGIVWFAVSVLAWTRPFGMAQIAWSAVGFVTVAYLVFVEIVLVGAICLWCTAVHALVLAIVLIAVTLWSMQASRAR